MFPSVWTNTTHPSSMSSSLLVDSVVLASALVLSVTWQKHGVQRREKCMLPMETDCLCFCVYSEYFPVETLQSFFEVWLRAATHNFKFLTCTVIVDTRTGIVRRWPFLGLTPPVDSSTASNVYNPHELKEGVLQTGW